MIFKIIILLAFITSIVLAQKDIDARAIMEKVYARDDGTTLEQNMLMLLVDKHGQIRSRDIKTFTKDYDQDVYKIMFFNSPADVKNSAFLTYDYSNSKKEDDQWLYLPALKKIKRIPSSEKSSSFMGSDFSYFDMGKRNIDDYSYKFIKESTVHGKKVWIIESLPLNQKVIDESNYEKTISLVRQDNYVVVRSIDFTTNGQMKYMEVKKMYQEKEIWLAQEVSMTVKKLGVIVHSTILKFSNTKLNENIDDYLFTSRQLTKGYYQ